MLVNRLIASAAVLILVAAACTGSGSQVASDRCASEGLEYVRSGWGDQVRLVAAVPSDGESVATWLETPGKPVSADQVAAWRDVGAKSVVICFYDGDFSSFPGPPEASKNYTRMMLLISDGEEPIVQSVGPASDLAPDQGPAAR